MTGYHSVKFKLLDSHPDKLKSATKIGVTVRLSSGITGTDETNFSHSLLLTDR